jgi:hypothetical protein
MLCVALVYVQIVSNNIRYQIIFCASVYCQIIINCGVLIFTDFMVHLNDENKNPTKYNVPIDCCMYHLKLQIQECMDPCILWKPRKLVPMNESIFTVLQCH